MTDAAGPQQALDPVQPGAPRWERWAVALVLALYGAWGLAYLLHQPWGGGLDEPQHRAYFRVLAEDHRLPWLYREGREWVRYRDAHAMHPPAYYLAVLPVYLVAQHAPEETVRLVLRLTSLALGGLGLLLVHAIARAAFAGDRLAALAATLLVGLTPLYLLVSAIVNNDIASVLALGLLFYLALVRWPDGTLSWRRVLLLGLVGGLAGLTKGTSEVAALGAGAWLVYSGSRAAGRGPALLRAATYCAVVAALALPWHLRNLHLYGTLSYMPNDGKPRYLPVDSGMLVCLMHDNFPGVLRFVLQWQVNTLWSQKDWIPEANRALVYGLLWALLAAGLVLATVCRIRRQERILPGRVWGAFLAATLPLWAMAVYIACMEHQGWAEGGRYLLPLLPAAACTAVLPIRLVPERLAALRWGLVGLVAVAGLALNAVCYSHLVNVLVPLYHPGG